MLKAELALAAEDFPAARRALGDLATEHPTARSLTLMAAIERGEGASDAVVRAWLAPRRHGPPAGRNGCARTATTSTATGCPSARTAAPSTRSPGPSPPRAEMHIPGTGMLPLIAGDPDLPATRETPGAPEGDPPAEGYAEPSVVVVQDAPAR